MIKYPGRFITDDMEDDDDDTESAQANTIAHKFSCCFTQVKVALFKAYCALLHTTHLWPFFFRKKYKVCRSYKVPAKMHGESSLRLLEEEVLVRCLYL